MLNAPAGIYTVKVKLHDCNGNNKTSRFIGNLSCRGGNKPLPSISLSTQGRDELMTKIKVHENGNVTLLCFAVIELRGLIHANETL